jgi:hypothetical protein
MRTPRLVHKLATIQHAEENGLRPVGYTKICLQNGDYDQRIGLVKFELKGWLTVNQWVEGQNASPRRPQTVQGADLRHRPGLGDLVSSVATPIARALKLPCIDPATRQLRPESGCAKRKALLNKIHLA